MDVFNPDKLSVEFRDGITKTKPIIHRRYTLTHSDITADLFLVIGLRYASDTINAMRDEVLGEWTISGGCYVFNVYLYIDGQFNQTVAAKRNDIFRRELPLALNAIRYGDSKLFTSHLELDNAPIIVHFISVYPQFNTVENWGIFSNYDVHKD